MAKSEQLRPMLRRAQAERHLPPTPEHWRPQVRGDCIDGPRPCPYVSCRHNLLLEVTPTGSLKMPHDMPWEVPEGQASCALDVADDGEHSVEEVAAYLGNCRDIAAKGLLRAVNKIEQLRGMFDF